MTVTLLFEDNRTGLCEKCTRLLRLSPCRWTPKDGGAERTVWLCARDWPEADQLPDSDLSGWLPVRPDGWTPFPQLAIGAEPVRLQAVRFKCPYCPKSWSKRGPAAEHISRCWLNPGIRGCKTCIHHQPAYTAPAASWCEPGRQCSCNDMDEHCSHEDGPETLAEPIAACPLWKSRIKEVAAR